MPNTIAVQYTLSLVNVKLAQLSNFGSQSDFDATRSPCPFSSPRITCTPSLYRGIFSSD